MDQEFYNTASFGVELGLFNSWAWRHLMDDLKVKHIVPVNPYRAVLVKLDWEVQLDCERMHNPANLDQSKGIWGANGFRGTW